MNTFYNSTQYKNWMFTKEGIQKIQKIKIDKILKRIDEVNLIIKKHNDQKACSNRMEIEDEDQNNANNLNDKKEFQRYISVKKLITPENERDLIIKYSKNMMKIIKSKSTTLKSTSITFFRRFYLKKSILDYDPVIMMAAAVYLGAKATPLKFSIKRIEEYFNKPINHEKLFDYEFYLSTILDYDFYVYSPYLALFGLLNNLEQKDFFLSQNSENYVSQNDFKDGCIDIIDKMHLTDNIFLYSYSEIALASIFLICEEKKLDFNNIVEKLELDKIINVNEFLEGPYKIMKENYELIPKYESDEVEENEIYKIEKELNHFYKDFPLYQAKLAEERAILKKKMDDFDESFEKLEKPILNSLNKYNK